MSSSPHGGGVASEAAELVQAALRGYHPRDFVVDLWDGSRLEAEAEPRFTLRLLRPAALGSLRSLDSDLAIAEAYIYGDIDIDGDIEAVCAVVRHLLDGLRLSPLERLRWLARLRRFPRPDRPQPPGARLRGRRSSLARDRRAVTSHYDRSNDFFALFLDQRMVYSCAYFDDADGDLETAQERKLDLICRKLRLRPGERLLDIGCGWGALVIHAAERYGVEAVGITLSEPQAALARRRIEEAGLGGRCRIEVRDYRELGSGAFDKVASVGMVEHVAPRRLGEYFACAHRVLRPGGAMLNHGIASPDRAGRRSEFVRRHVFPDAELAPIWTTLAAAAGAGFEVRDLEGLREHYTLTLRRWVRQLEAHRARAVEIVGEATYRTWRLYMAGSADGFATNRLEIFQMLLVKPDRGESGLPLTRADWYQAVAIR